MTHCLFQTLAVLNPLKQTDHSIMQDTDLAGPLVFCLAFGGSLMLVSCQLKEERSNWVDHCNNGAISSGSELLQIKLFLS